MTARPGIPEPAAQSVVLRNVSWDTYERLLSEHQDVCNPRFAFDQGMLQIMVTSFEHETVNRLIARLFETIAEELAMDYVNAGSTTFKKQEAERGFEPNTAFYVRHAELVRGKGRINLWVDPAPDLFAPARTTLAPLPTGLPHAPPRTRNAAERPAPGA
jgi:Uma2 family endonuclease